LSRGYLAFGHEERGGVPLLILAQEKGLTSLSSQPLFVRNKRLIGFRNAPVSLIGSHDETCCRSLVPEGGAHFAKLVRRHQMRKKSNPLGLGSYSFLGIRSPASPGGNLRHHAIKDSVKEQSEKALTK